MEQKKKIQHTNIRFTILSFFSIAIIVILLSIGYATATYNLSLSQMQAYIRSDQNVRITGLRKINATNGGTESNLDFTANHIYSDATLPNANSSIIYEVAVTNFGNVEMGITNITGLPENMTYTISGYNLETTLCDSNNNSKCTLNSVTKFQITISYTENGYNSSSTHYNLNLEFTFTEMIYTARIGNNYYTTIQAAINASPTNHTETTIVLLKNTYERIKICAGHNITFDMQHLVLHNRAFNPGSVGDPVVEIFGAKNCQGQTVQAIGATLKMINGTILTEADQSAINVEPSGNFIMEGGTIISTGNRQALYVKEGGSAEIRGNSYLRAQALVDAPNNNYRATAQCVGGQITVISGTIESIGGDGIAFTSESTTTIGVKDGNVSTSNPIIKGKTIGMYILTDSTVNFYDGVIEGQTQAIYNESEIDDVEANYEIVHSGEVIVGDDYITAYLGVGVTVTFDASPGTVDEASRVVGSGAEIGPLPIPIRTGYEFVGWLDQNDNMITSSTIITAPAAYHAAWQEYMVAQIGNTKYETLAEAIAAVPANVTTTITVINDTSEKVTIASNKKIILDIDDNTISAPDNGVIITNNGEITLVGGTIASTATTAVITNNGTMYMTGGTITTNASSTSAVNNSAGATFDISGGSIIATGLRQAIYDSGGLVRISGTAFLSSSAKVESNKNRGTVQSDSAASNIIITGGTIISTATNGIGVSNVGTLTIGVKDGNISTTTPVIRGVGKGIHNTKTLRIYDGILQSLGTPLSGNTTALEDNSQPVTSTQQINGQTYNVWYLQSTAP